jgi:hypothetical protein
MADMIDQCFWTVVPYHLVKHLPNLRLSPMGVVPQRDRRPRTIVDYSFYNINRDTVPIAPSEAMQFGRAFERILHKIHHANKKHGPVHLIKVDLSDGFYRVPLAPSHIPALGVAFPYLPHEQPLVALPLVLPMGWVSSPPYFCALTETAADLANTRLRTHWSPPPHPLSYVANHPNNEQPVSRFSSPVSLSHLCLQPSSPHNLAQSIPSRAPLPSIAAPIPTGSPPPRILAVSTSSRLQPTLPVSQIQPSALSTTDMIPTPVPLPLPSAPFLARSYTQPLSYVDVYMDDFLGLAQGHSGLRNKVRATIFHSIDAVLRPLHPSDDVHRKAPISMKKLHKGDARWSTRKILLGWLVDTIAETISLPDHRADRLQLILQDLCQRRRISLKAWQQQLGELRSMALALPGGRGLFSTLYTGLTQPNNQSSQASRIRLIQPIKDALLDLSYLAKDLQLRPTRIAEITDSLPVAYGAADASGMGMGGVWLSGDSTFTPTLWRHPFPSFVQQQLVTWEHPSGTITNSDLELLAQIASQDVIIFLRDCRERTVSTFTDNISSRAWQRKGSKATLGPAAYLLRILALHQRHHRYRATSDYISGPSNCMADDASRLWNLSNSELLSHFNSTYPQHQSWQLSQPQPNLLSALIMALQCKRSVPASFLPEPNHAMPIGFDGSSIVATWASHLRFMTTPTQSPPYKYSPIGTAPAPSHQAVNLYDLAQWKQHSEPLGRHWPAWGPRTHV